MHRISLPNEYLEGPNNAYLVDDAETVLVDTGGDTPETRRTLREGLAAAGRSVGDLDRIYLTHYHIDHCGTLGWLVEESGASVHAHPADLDLIVGDEDAWAALQRRRRSLLDSWGVPSDARDRLFDAFHEGADLYTEVPVAPIADGTTADLGGTEMRALHTPGHSLGHIAFELPARNEVVSGDALLPVYTPNVGGADVRVEDPLANYVRALERLASRDFDRAWPGHRDPIADPTTRASAIVTHHEERALRVLETLADVGPATPWTVSAHLFGDLDGVHVLHGPGEAYAHLDHLAGAGLLERGEDGYRLTDDTAVRLEDWDADTWQLAV